MSTQGSTALKVAGSKPEREKVMELLQQQKLPVSDISDETLLYSLTDEGIMIGTAGLDIFNDCALLRSVSVSEKIRGKGYGRILNEKIEQEAKGKGVTCIYLITNTAKDFFEREGYDLVERTAAPDVIKQTDQFTGLCPSSAVVMKKYI